MPLLSLSLKWHRKKKGWQHNAILVRSTLNGSHYIFLEFPATSGLFIMQERYYDYMKRRMKEEDEKQGIRPPLTMRDVERKLLEIERKVDELLERRNNPTI